MSQIISVLVVFPVESSGVFAAVDNTSGFWTRRSGVLAQFNHVPRTQGANLCGRYTLRPGNYFIREFAATMNGLRGVLSTCKEHESEQQLPCKNLVRKNASSSKKLERGLKLAPYLLCGSISKEKSSVVMLKTFLGYRLKQIYHVIRYRSSILK